jgi:hypothetical protein
MVGIMFGLCLNELFSQIDNSFIKLKEERNLLESNVKSLEKEIQELKYINKNDYEETISSKGIVSSNEINRVLVAENRKLHVRCDMLEEEINKIEITKQLFFRSHSFCTSN